MNIKIRPLVQKDREILTNMILKLSETNNEKFVFLTSKITSATANVKSGENNTQPILLLFLDIFKQLYFYLADDIKQWFASLLEIDILEFEKMPFNVELKIIEQLITSGDIADFFTTALQLAKKIR